MSLGRFCPLAVVGERLGLLGAKPHLQQGSGCVGHSQMPLERRPLARLAAEGPGELKDQYIISRLDGCLRMLSWYGEGGRSRGRTASGWPECIHASLPLLL